MKKLRRKLDEVRYIKKLDDVIRGKLPGIIANEDILSLDDDDTVVVRIPVIEEPYFKIAFPQEGASGGDGNSGSNGGNGGGGDHYYEINLTVDELAELLFSYLKLPKLQPKNSGNTDEQYRVQGISKTGPLSRIHRKRTFYEILKRKQVSRDAFIYRDIRTVETPIYNAVVYLVRDYSGSMTERKKFKIRSACFWILKFLKLNYPQVSVKFVVHDTEAKFTDEHEFFYSSEGGGTICSSAFSLILNDFDNINLEDTNVYVFYFSDGENYESDNPVLIEKIKQMLPMINMFTYGEVYDDQYAIGSIYSRTLFNILSFLDKEFDNVFIEKLLDIKNFLLKIFGEENAIQE